MQLRSLCLLSLSLSVFGPACSSGGVESDMQPVPEELNIPPAPSRGFQLILPVVEDIPAGTSLELCTWTDHFVEQDTEVAELVGAQIGGGHHINVYVTQKPKTPGLQRICDDSDMVDLTYVAAAVGDGSSGLSKPPGGLAFFLPKGAQVVVNQHFLNASPTPRRGQSAINVHYADPGKPYVRSSALSFADTSIMVPPGESSFEMSCAMAEDMSAWLFFPHMHEWGRHILIEQTTPSGTTKLFDADWNTEYVFHPPQITRPLDAPLMLRKGDTIRVRCTWNNTTGTTLTFGQEMCVGSGQFADSQRIGNSVCFGGRWSRF